MLKVVSWSLIGICVLWVVMSFGPAVKAEAGYQFSQGLQAVGADSVRDLFIPTVGSWRTDALSKHRQYGIVIPKIQLDEPVVFNVNPNDERQYTEALKEGIAHAASTGFPGTNELGYYFAHSATSAFIGQYKAVFYLLGKLEAGDEIYIWHEGKRFEYKVTTTIVTDPYDLSFLDQEYGKETIVLQTCWPLGTALRRKLVFAELVGE